MNKRIPARTWRDKANEIIAADSEAAWRKANFKKNGQRYKKHRPYPTSDLARQLMNCLDRDDEKRAKQIFCKERLI